MLKQRIITALILLPIALCGFFLLKGANFALFIGLVVVLGAWEWARMAGLASQPMRIAYAAVVGVLLFLLYLLPGLAPWVLTAAVLWWLLATWLVLTFPASSEHWASALCKLAIGLVILLPAWQGLVLIKQWPLGNWLILSVMILVWAADIGAYFTGKAIGKRKMAPKVSPGKSWEGFYGGLAVCLVITFVVGVLRGWSLGEFIAGLAAAAVVVVISVVGDLTESMFKRQAGLKDSSNLLPGHGGVLDRIDSLTAAIPVFAVLLWAADWGVM
ncbi:phosphatidate cytidylyltransferase [Pseudomonas sp. DTU_2021_1001937_2_SI_NGA_ILE_001]|uniref:phosphatidate cytidylyltransferase n=1 Tax=Pseudomonas sp. DTU_2021_1001937_2_SI_NGA_ILE_001 TaxID=3077589 RepID=UPI0028FC15B0|nr:phosphatidate cytidylyltransferase [Pseudomonas sp. DTU_2021_1001937_2_SI_NGA_ILE_001]WNW11342.1 phosphatidate cytidylyltransferase [Pseudomonas sp. DTU_2021_1001937_2_SI_NGA_ILE_001]